ncbi:MAG: glutamate-5-semialdehyde dehydrogenase [Peptoniphilaceae bacterium]|nr:glutamate-5-semialdehyde dehydrogenase [Peptoniphilaceae bacterium]
MKILEIARKTKEASSSYLNCSLTVRNALLLDLAHLLDQNRETVQKANQRDILAARRAGISESLIDRLLLTETRLDSMMEGVKQVVALPDPIGVHLKDRTLENGLHLEKITVPFGTIAVIFESRPNVIIDCASLCLKAGSTCILKGGKEARETNLALTSLIKESLRKNQLSEDCVNLVADASHEDILELMRAPQYVDLLIPRGGAHLIRYTVENATVPVIETGAGVCHVYVDRAADPEMAIRILINAKTGRPSVCNAMETMLISREIAPKFLPKAAEALQSHGVTLEGDAEVQKILPTVTPIEPDEYDVEHLDLRLAVKLVEDVAEAVTHIRRFGTRHSESIVTEDPEAAEYFFRNVDAAAIYHNASTRFTDGFVFGLGAEIGISTQKMHARGPMGLRELTTYTYHIHGNGQIRE